MIRTSFVATSFWNCFCAFHHKRATHITNVASGLGFNCKFTLWIIRTRIKYTEASFSLCNVTLFAFWTNDSRTFFGDFRFVLFYKFTFWITWTWNKCATSITTFSNDKFASTTFYFSVTTVWAFFASFFWASKLLPIEHQCSITFWIIGTWIKFSTTGKLNNHFGSAFRTFHIFSSLIN